MSEIGRDLIDGFDLNHPPAGFIQDPFPYYRAMLAHQPVLPQPDGSFILSRFADLDRIYRDTTLYSSDKKQAFLLCTPVCAKSWWGRLMPVRSPIWSRG